MNKLTPRILMRSGIGDEEEEIAAKLHFDVSPTRAIIPRNSLVIGRYACLPFYNELEKDVIDLGSKLINSYEQHSYVANFDYYEDLKDLTFQSWDRFEDIPHAIRDSAFVVKGRTNSRKGEWNTKMFAPNFARAVQIGADLRNDGLIGQQGIVIRKFTPLETFELSITGMPVTNEWRLFYLHGERVAYGYYWGSIDDWGHVEKARPEFERNGILFADQVARRISKKIPFVVIDIARTANGEWIVVELNDGTQAGLNGTIDPNDFYSNIKRVLKE